MPSSRFNTKNGAGSRSTVRNAAGGVSHKMSSGKTFEALMLTTTFGDDCHNTGDSAVEDFVEAFRNASIEEIKDGISKAHEAGRKDSVAMAVAMVASAYPSDFNGLFETYIDTARRLRTFVQFIRSGVTGRKCFGSRMKKAIRRWFASKRAEELFNMIGQSPSIKDIIRMVHPKPKEGEIEAYRYILGYDDINLDALPPVLRQYEEFKAGKTDEAPNVNFQRLLNLDLKPSQYSGVVANMPPATLLANINMLERRGAFDSKKTVKAAAEKIKKLVETPNGISFQAATAAILHIGEPQLANAVESIFSEKAAKRLFGKNVLVAVDVSGSMSDPITSAMGKKDTVISRTDVAASMLYLIANSRANLTPIAFDTSVHMDLERKVKSASLSDMVRLCRPRGGTNVQCVFDHILQNEIFDLDAVVIITDDESWGHSGSMATAWKKVAKKLNDGARLAYVKLAAEKTSAVKESDNCQIFAGGTDQTMNAILDFIDGESTEQEDDE